MIKQQDEVPALPPGWRRLLLRLGEECAEVVQAASKVQIFGHDDDFYGNGVTALSKLADEVDDVRVIIEMCIELGIDIRPCDDRQARKRAKLEDMFNYAKKKIAASSYIPEEVFSLINARLIERTYGQNAVIERAALLRQLCDALNMQEGPIREAQWIERALELYEKAGWEVKHGVEYVELTFTTTARLVVAEEQ